MEQPRIRPMEAADLDQIMEIERVSFSNPWSRESYAGELHNHFAHYIVVEDDEGVAAYAGIWCVFDEAHVTNVAVKPDKRRRGIGTLLMKGLIDVARENGATMIFLEVRPSNLAAINLYRSLGFLPFGVRRGYYNDNHEDALVLSKTLIPDESAPESIVEDK